VGLIWLTWHQAVAVNEWRGCVNAVTPLTCKVCNNGSVEFVLHRFWECTSAKKAWSWGLHILQTALQHQGHRYVGNQCDNRWQLGDRDDKREEAMQSQDNTGSHGVSRLDQRDHQIRRHQGDTGPTPIANINAAHGSRALGNGRAMSTNVVAGATSTYDANKTQHVVRGNGLN
jgi:hypothetical protein